MNIGIALLMTQHDFNTIDLARKVEELGFESLWAPEHGIVPNSGSNSRSLKRCCRG